MSDRSQLVPVRYKAVLLGELSRLADAYCCSRFEFVGARQVAEDKKAALREAVKAYYSELTGEPLERPRRRTRKRRAQRTKAEQAAARERQRVLAGTDAE